MPYPSIHQCCQREVVKEISEIFPHVGIAILSQALVIKPVDLSDLSALMVATKDSDSVGKSHLHRTDSLYIIDRLGQVDHKCQLR